MTLLLSSTAWVPPMSRYGLAIQERREFIGYKTQRDLVRALTAMEEAGDLPSDLKSFSQQWLSTMETDRDGSAIAGARPRQVRTLAYMLRLSAEEFEETVGVAIPKVPAWPGASPTKMLETFAGPPIDFLGVPERRPRHIPDALQHAVNLFGRFNQWASLQEPRWIYFLAGLHHKVTPATPEEWLELYLDLRKRFDPPEPEN